jgi:hypothetical protein
LFALAPFINLTLLGAAGEPTVNEDADWKYQVAFSLPCASNVKSPFVILYVPLADL